MSATDSERSTEKNTMKKAMIVLLVFLFAFFGIGCGKAAEQPAQTQESAATVEAEPAAAASSVPEDPENEIEEKISETGETEMEKTLRLFLNDTEVTVDWEENESVEALRSLVSAEPLAVQMSMYGGFEQVGSLGTSLPRNDAQTTTQAGDIVLYAGNQIVVFYGSNSWAYTRLGRITDVPAEGMADLLANGDVVVTLSLE